MFTELKKEGTKKLEEETPGIPALNPSSGKNSFLESDLAPIREATTLEENKTSSQVELMAKSKSHDMNSLTGGIGENTPGGGTKSFYGTPGGPMHAPPAAAASGTPGVPSEGSYINRG